MNKVDMLCDKINNHLGLHSRQVGSIERYTDSATNSIVRIDNPYGGHTTLISGDDKQLIAFLSTIMQK